MSAVELSELVEQGFSYIESISNLLRLPQKADINSDKFHVQAQSQLPISVTFISYML